MRNNPYEKAIGCIVAGMNAILTRAGITGVTIGQSALDYRKANYPLVLIEWNMAKSKQYAQKWLSDDRCKLMASRALEFNSRVLAYSTNHPTDCLLILESLALGKGTEIFQQAMQKEMATQGLKALAVQSIDNLEQEDTKELDNQIFYGAGALMQWNLNEPLELGNFPVIGHNRADIQLTFTQQGPVFRANIQAGTIDFQATNNYKLVFSTAPASPPMSLYLNDNQYSINRVSETEFESATVATGDRVADGKLSQKINYQLANKRWLFEFNTEPDIKLEAKSDKNTYTRTISRP